MKTNIHPEYHTNTKVHCACGNKWTTGSTISEINLGICSNCHPFYTGNEKIVDTLGRVEKFKKRMEKSAQKVRVKKKVRIKK